MASRQTEPDGGRTRIDPFFRPLLASAFDLDDLCQQDHTIYALDRDLRLVFMNPAWFRFAHENGAPTAIVEDWDLGRSVLDACPGELRGFYANAYTRVLESDKVWDFDYECSSPEQYRLLHQTVYPLPGGAGLLVVNSPVVTREHDAAERPARAPDAAAYRNAEGALVQCSHCRRIRRNAEQECWDWVPEWVARVPRVTRHGLCSICLNHYYPGQTAHPEPGV